MSEAKQEFKAAFLSTCAAHGLSPQQAIQVIEKVAAEVKDGGDSWLSKLPIIGSLYDKTLDVGAHAAKETYSHGLKWGLPLLAVGPGVLGGVIGNRVAAMSDIEDDDVEDAKLRETLATYQQLAQQRRRQRLLRDLAALPAGRR